MTTYVDYTFYTATYHGASISLADFPGLAVLASAEIDILTFDRTAAIILAGTDTALIEKIKFAVCSVAEAIQKLETISENGRVQSERVGQFSVTYVDDKSNRDQEKTRKVAKRFIGTSGLMFPGFFDGEYGGEVEDED